MDLNDLLDRKATAWNRAWAILLGGWLVALGRHFSGPTGALAIGVGVLILLLTTGPGELGLAVWQRFIQPVAVDWQRPKSDPRQLDGLHGLVEPSNPADVDLEAPTRS